MRSFPWDSLVVSMGDDGFPIYDRDYMASDLREVYETFFSNGVFLDTEDALQVTAGEGMTVHVAPGKCCIRGTIGYEKSIRELALQASSSQDRIDTVVARWNANVEMRNIDLYVKSGVAGATPVAPTLTRSETVFEIGLCDIFVAKNSGAVSAARITDTRMNTNRCGIVTPLVKIDMTSFYETMQAALAELEAKLDEQTQIAVDLAQSALDGTTAGHLQNQINGINNQLSSMVGEKDGWHVIYFGETVICSKLHEVPVSNNSVASKTFTLPFEFIEIYSAVSTIGTTFGNFGDTLGANVKNQTSASTIIVSCQNHQASFAYGENVPIYTIVIGKIK